MKLLFLSLLSGLALVSDAAPVRNPFWPIGYEGVREEISANVRQKPKPIVKETPKSVAAPKPQPRVPTAAEKAKAEAEAKLRAEEAKRLAEIAERKKREIGEEHWTAARKALRFGGRVKVHGDERGERMSVMINGNTYVDGDLVSFTHDHRRFTWRVTGLTEADTLKLERVKARYLENGDWLSKVKGGNE